MYVEDLLKLYSFVCAILHEMQIDAHVGGVNDIAFSQPNKQLCIITCGDDKAIKVCTIIHMTNVVDF